MTFRRRKRARKRMLTRLEHIDMDEREYKQEMKRAIKQEGELTKYPPFAPEDGTPRILQYS